MSNTKIRTGLDGYDTQLFLPSLDEINLAYDLAENRRVTLEAIGKTIRSYRGMDRPVTDDGYTWFWGMHFATRNGMIGVLFPWSQDWDKNDGVSLDRSIAVYTNGDIHELDANSIVEYLGENIPKQRRHLPHKMTSRRF